MLLDHVNLRCQDPERMVEFIERLGCASNGHRPDFESQGFWMYDDSDRAVIHVSIGADPEPVSASVGSSTKENHQGAGVVDHIAFRVSETADSLKARLLALGIDSTQRVNTLAGVTQVLVQAPEGLIIELQIPITA